MSCRRGNAPDNSAQSCEPRTLALPGKLDALLDVGVIFNQLTKGGIQKRKWRRGVTTPPRAVPPDPMSYDMFLNSIETNNKELYEQLGNSKWSDWRPTDDRQITQIDEFRALKGEGMSKEENKLHHEIEEALYNFLYPPPVQWKSG